MAIEEPEYTITLKEQAFEIRQYPPLIVAQVTVGGERGEAGNAGFRLLADYIFGGNTQRQSIAMTAPVVQAPRASESIAMTAPVIQAGGPGAWTIRFIMPASYTLATLPTPNNPKVQLKAVPAARFAVARFSGLAGLSDIEKNTAALNRFIAANKLLAVGPAALARYNPPWTPWFMRRNEIMVPVEPPTP